MSENHTAVSGEVDIGELYSIDGGDNWFAKKSSIGSGVKWQFMYHTMVK